MIDLRFGDCLELMEDIPDKSIDMILADLPYGTTNCKWDTVIPLKDYILDKRGRFIYQAEWLLASYTLGNGCTFFDSMEYWEANKKKGLWTHYNRIIKDNGAILLHAQTPFDKVLGESNTKMLKYEWIWEKTAATSSGGGNTDRYPRSVLKFPSDKQKSKLHPTQKPLALEKYLIKTYTNEGDIVLDNTVGSGTVMVGCQDLGRHGIGIDNNGKIFSIAEDRIYKNR